MYFHLRYHTLCQGQMSSNPPHVQASASFLLCFAKVHARHLYLPQAVDIETMTETSLTEILLSLPPAVEVMFHNRSKVVKTITVT